MMSRSVWLVITTMGTQDFASANLPDERHPVGARHPEIGHDQVGELLLEALPGLLPVGGLDRQKPGLELLAQRPSGHRFVVDDEHDRAALPRSAPPRAQQPRFPLQLPLLRSSGLDLDPLES